MILTDIKYNLFCNPLRPVYRAAPESPLARSAEEASWVSYEGGVREIGWSGAGFAFDNEFPRHSTFLAPYSLATRAVTNGEFRGFIEDDGYARPELWLDVGYATVEQQGWEHPQYWIPGGGTYQEFTLGGVLPLSDAEPVSHLSYFEADAYARWSGHRLPTEAEWEVAVEGAPVAGNFAESGRYHPLPAGAGTDTSARQMYGDVWEWTASPYVGYPGFRPPEGAIGEYNGKFMCNQQVLRGGSCVTSGSHMRPTYRNFFPPEARWQFAGVRLAKDA